MALRTTLVHATDDDGDGLRGFQKTKLNRRIPHGNDDDDDDNDDDGDKGLNDIRLTFFQSGSLVDFPAGNLAERRYKLIESVKAVLDNITYITAEMFYKTVLVKTAEILHRIVSVSTKTHFFNQAIR